jgi:hypothetical protein
MENEVAVPSFLELVSCPSISQARHARKEANLNLRQRTLPLIQEETVA